MSLVRESPWSRPRDNFGNPAKLVPPHIRMITITFIGRRLDIALFGQAKSRIGTPMDCVDVRGHCAGIDLISAKTSTAYTYPPFCIFFPLASYF